MYPCYTSGALFMKIFRVFLAVLVLAAIDGSIAYAQVATNLSGTVTDPTGAAVSAATVTANNLDTGIARTALTNQAGQYELLQLPIGHYKVSVKKEGFAERLRTDILLVAGQDATIDISMLRSTSDACASGHEFATTDCALTWHGITLYGEYDIGVGYVSHGLPENGYNYEGESLVNRNGYQH